jgi:hypothetical protein
LKRERERERERKVEQKITGEGKSTTGSDKFNPPSGI